MIEERGYFYHIDTLEKFEEKLGEENHPTVLKLNKEIEDAIHLILTGGINPEAELVAP